MNSEINNPLIAQIERYLLGEMQGEELQKFQKRITEDPELQKEVQQYRQLIEQLDRLRLLKKIEKAVRNSGQAPKTFLSIPLKTWLVAASILLGTGAIVFRLFLMPANPPIVNQEVIQQTKSDTGEVKVPATTTEYGHIAFVEKPDSTVKATTQVKSIKTTKPKVKNNEPLKTAEITNPPKEQTPTIPPPQNTPPQKEQIADNLTKDAGNENYTNVRAGATDDASKLLKEFYLYPKNMAPLPKWQEAYKEYTQQHPTQLAADTVLTLIEQMHKQQGASNYLQKLNKLSKADPNNFAIKYYLAHSYLTEAKPEKALPYLEDICNAKAAFSFTPDAQWLRALSYVFTNPTKAKELLSVLTEDYKHPYSKDAFKLAGRIFPPEKK